MGYGKPGWKQRTYAEYLPKMNWATNILVVCTGGEI